MQLTKLRSQRGVFLPLVAAVAMGVFFVLMILGIDTNKVRAAQTDLNSKLDVICGDIAHSPTSYTDTVTKFQAHISRLIEKHALKYSVIENVELIMPTMPGNGYFGFKSSVNFAVSDLGGGNPVDPASAATPVNCSFDVGSIHIPCVIRGSAYGNVSGNPIGDNNFPPNLWNNLENAGNSVGCIVNARAKTFLLGHVPGSSSDSNKLRAKSVWGSPLRAHRPIFDPTNETASSPGLTIAIGTEMFTSFFDGRYRFKDGSSLRNMYDARKAQNFGFKRVSGNPAHSIPFSGATLTMPALNPLASTSIWENTVATPSDSIDSLDPGPTITNLNQLETGPNDAGHFAKPSDIESMLVSCMNPAVLIRNSFLSTMVELASRNGQLRNMTEILHMNPVHRDLNFFVSPLVPNSPTKIVGFGEDLTLANYQVPFVFYHSGLNDPNEVPPPGTISGEDGLGFAPYKPSYNKNGWINPFNGCGGGVSCSPSDPLWVEHHALIASQLRFCYHLFTGQIGSPKGLERNSDFQNFLNEPAYFPAPPFTFPNVGGSPVWPAIKTASLNHWDQECPWTGGNTPNYDPACSRSDGTGLLTAANVMSVLGTTQMCPYTENKIERFPTGYEVGGRTINPCPLTEDPYGARDLNYELQPDVLGAVRYWMGANPFDGTIAPIRAISSPGIFPILDTSIPYAPSGIPAEPFCSAPDCTNGAYSSNSNRNSHLLLVLHKPGFNRSQGNNLQGDSIRQEVMNKIGNEISTLRQMLADNNPPGSALRPITIVYMPTTYYDSQFASDLGSAFTATDNGGPNGDTYFTADRNGVTSPISLYNISPYDSFWGKKCGILDQDLGGVEKLSDAQVQSDGSVTTGDGSVKPQWKVFRDYWDCLLTAQDKSIVGIAYNIYAERILSRELKF